MTEPPDVPFPDPPAAPALPSASPLAAFGSMWGNPEGTIRALLDRGDGGLWPWLLLAEVLAGPCAWVTCFLLSPASLRHGPAVEGFAGFGMSMALTIGSLVGGVLLLRMIAARRVPVRDMMLAMAWGLVPILFAVPIGIVFGLGFRTSWPHYGPNWIAAGVCAFVLWWFAFFMTLFATLEAGRWTANALVTLLLLGWIGMHGMVMGTAWFVYLLAVRSGPVGLD